MTVAAATDTRPEDLAGRRWAGYIRESTKGQADRYGPEIQRAEQTRYADRYGLVATGLEYMDLVSGKDTLRRTDFTKMLADAGTRRFDVLLVHDTSRFARNVADSYRYREELTQSDVTVVFCSDGLISGNVDTYEVEGLKTVADAAYIRRLSRNVGRGYEQKWLRFAGLPVHAFLIPPARITPRAEDERLGFALELFREPRPRAESHRGSSVVRPASGGRPTIGGRGTARSRGGAHGARVLRLPGPGSPCPEFGRLGHCLVPVMRQYLDEIQLPEDQTGTAATSTASNARPKAAAASVPRRPPACTAIDGPARPRTR